MKKILLFLFAIVGLATNLRADEKEGVGTCKVEGTTNGYVQATAYLSAAGEIISGNIVLSNSSEIPLMTAKIKVTVVYKHHFAVSGAEQNVAIRKRVLYTKATTPSL